MIAPWKFRHYGRGVNLFDPYVILRPELVTLGDGCRIDAFTKIEGGQGVNLGANVHIASFSHINAGGGVVEFGDHSGCASHTVICGGATDHRMLVTTPQDGNIAQRGRTVIGQYVLIFAGAIILPGVTVGHGAVVGAGAVVRQDVPDLAIVAGVPARVIGWRDRRVACDLYLALYPDDRYNDAIHHIIDDLNFEDRWVETASQGIANRMIDDLLDEPSRAVLLRRYKFLRALLKYPLPAGWENDD